MFSLVFQSYGGAILVSGAQGGFINEMIKTVLQGMPDINKGTLILTGATEIRNIFFGEQLPIVLDGYMHGIRVVFAVAIAAIGAATLISFAMPWKKLDMEKIKQNGGAA